MRNKNCALEMCCKSVPNKLGDFVQLRILACCTPYMKTLIAILFPLLIGSFCYSQDKLDTTWKINNHQFRVLLERNENDPDELKTQITLFKDNQPLLSDSLLCCALMVDLNDINGDSYNDLQIFQCSGARANETFNLYLFQPYDSVFKKVKGLKIGRT